MPVAPLLSGAEARRAELWAAECRRRSWTAVALGVLAAALVGGLVWVEAPAWIPGWVGLLAAALLGGVAAGAWLGAWFQWAEARYLLGQIERLERGGHGPK